MGEAWYEKHRTSHTHTFFLKKEKQKESWRDLHFIMENFKKKPQTNKQKTKQAVDKEGEMGEKSWGALFVTPHPCNSIVNH